MTATATEQCQRSRIGHGHTWLRSTSPTAPAACAWCGAAADPVLDLGDPAPAVRRRRQRAEAEAADASGDLFFAGEPGA